MKKIRNLLIPVLSILLSFPSNVTTKSNPLARNDIKMKFFKDEDDINEIYQYDDFFDLVFETASLDDSSDSYVVFEGTTTADYGAFDFQCTFSMETLKYQACFEDTDGMAEEEWQGYADDKGRLELELEFFDEEYGTTECYSYGQFRDIQKLENFVLQDEPQNDISMCFIISGFTYVYLKIRAIVCVYWVVSEVAEQKKAVSNHYYNYHMELNGNGVNYGNYITNQRCSDIDGYKSANYRFGFTTFSGVGCEAAALYNSYIKIKQAYRLSDVIYNFERWMIEFAIGWGRLGSNPQEIARVLQRDCVSFSRFSAPLLGMNGGGEAYENYKNHVLEMDKANMIVSVWNSNDLMDGIHTYFVEKYYDTYITYNMKSEDSVHETTSLEEILSDGDRFIVGYFIHA